MRSVSVRACGAALLLLLVLFPAVPAFADDPAPDTVVLQGRIHMPPGTAEEEAAAVLAFGDEALPGTEAPQGRIAPPVGIASEAGEPPSIWELFLVWLQHRILPPVG